MQANCPLCTHPSGVDSSPTRGLPARLTEDRFVGGMPAVSGRRQTAASPAHGSGSALVLRRNPDHAALRIGEDAGLPVVRFPLERTADAHRAVEAGTTGKILIDVGA